MNEKLPVSEDPGVWVFNGSGATFPSGVFRSLEAAQSWIRGRLLSGTLTWYPLDVGAYDWAVAAGHFVPKREAHSKADFVETFTSGAQVHHHYERGKGGPE